ncbi:MAG TPA: hypothetical protein VGQ81_04970 [Acidobacteriota bacterium]|nr:hypothetical protein [Acidobacteriota bacterium]
MNDTPALPLKVVDGLELPEQYRNALKPAELLADAQGRSRRLPRFFFEIDSWDMALKTELTPHFALWEFINVDLRETEAMRLFPKYVPCAVTLLAVHLQVFREQVGTVVHVAANGGYRSPAHELSKNASTHCWATAVNIYRIGEDYLDDQEKIERYGVIAAKKLPSFWSRPYGHDAGCADDHLHLDIGYVSLVPRDAVSKE